MKHIIEINNLFAVIAVVLVDDDYAGFYDGVTYPNGDPIPYRVLSQDEIDYITKDGLYNEYNVPRWTYDPNNPPPPDIGSIVEVVIVTPDADQQAWNDNVYGEYQKRATLTIPQELNQINAGITSTNSDLATTTADLAALTQVVNNLEIGASNVQTVWEGTYSRSFSYGAKLILIDEVTPQPWCTLRERWIFSLAAGVYATTRDYAWLFLMQPEISNDDAYFRTFNFWSIDGGSATTWNAQEERIDCTGYGAIRAEITSLRTILVLHYTAINSGRIVLYIPGIYTRTINLSAGSTGSVYETLVTHRAYTLIPILDFVGSVEMIRVETPRQPGELPNIRVYNRQEGLAMGYYEISAAEAETTEFVLMRPIFRWYQPSTIRGFPARDQIEKII